MKPRQFQHRERGAALVEMTIVALVLLVLAAGMLEYGNLYGSSIDIASAARDGARAGVASTETVPKDGAVLASLKNRSGLKASQIDRVIIYKANDANGKVPDQCLNEYPPPANAACNVYLGSQINESSIESSPGVINWPASSRHPGSDYLGVYVKVKVESLTSLIWTPPSFSDQVAMLIEPTSSVAGGQDFDGFTTGNAPTTNRFWQWAPGLPDCANMCTPYVPTIDGGPGHSA